MRGGAIASRWARSAAVTSPGADTFARCAAPRMTASRDPAIPRAMTAPCHGGVAGSSDPRNHQRGRGDPREVRPQVHARDGLAAARVSFRVNVVQGGDEGGRDGGNRAAKPA